MLGHDAFEPDLEEDPVRLNLFPISEDTFMSILTLADRGQDERTPLTGRR